MVLILDLPWRDAPHARPDQLTSGNVKPEGGAAHTQAGTGSAPKSPRSAFTVGKPLGLLESQGGVVPAAHTPDPDVIRPVPPVAMPSFAGGVVQPLPEKEDFAETEIDAGTKAIALDTNDEYLEVDGSASPTQGQHSL